MKFNKPVEEVVKDLIDYTDSIDVEKFLINLVEARKMAREYDPGSDDITDYLLESQREDLLDDLEVFLITDICQPDYFSAQEEIYSTVLGYVTSREEAINFLVKTARPFAKCSDEINRDMAEQTKVVIYEDDEGARHYVNYELMKNLEAD